MNPSVEICPLKTPLGVLTLAVRGDTLVGLALPGHEAALRKDVARRFGPASRNGSTAGRSAVAGRSAPARSLRDYFAGDVGALDVIPVEAAGTPFQKKVWDALRAIPAGATESYSGLAKRIGAPLAVRAVAAANGANPIAVVVPCHRVVAKDGSLWGYGGGLERKRWLLVHEGALLA